VWTIRCAGTASTGPGDAGRSGADLQGRATRQEEIALDCALEEARLAGEQKLQPLRAASRKRG